MTDDELYPVAEELEEPGEFEDTGTYTVNVYSSGARMISEYTMEADLDNIASIEDAEVRARENLKSCNFADVVVVVTEETMQDFKQVQIKVRPEVAEAVWESNLKEIP
jgi:predicted ThiF/HesA family dinucleotide-utilizing enzyme